MDLTFDKKTHRKKRQPCDLSTQKIILICAPYVASECITEHNITEQNITIISQLNTICT